MSRISGGARPGGKGGARKNHEAGFTLWTGRASRSFPRNIGISSKGSPAGRPMGPPHPAEAWGELRRQFLSRRCFLRAPPMPPGHKLSLAGKIESQE